MNKDKHINSLNKTFSRRHFLGFLGLGVIGGAIIGTAEIFKFLYPNSLLEPPRKFNAGKIEGYNPDSVTYIKEQNVFIVRNKEGQFTALSAVCTHLGCTTSWKSGQGIITCPCHGSKYDKNGEVIDGPAPKPLPKFAMALDENRQIIVDMSKSADKETVL